MTTTFTAFHSVGKYWREIQSLKIEIIWDFTSQKQHLMRAIESPSLPAAAFWLIKSIAA
jgi:hypothetical protein